VLTNLQTSSELLLNRIFEDPAKKNTDGGNCLLIDGKLKKIADNYVFSYELRTAETYALSESAIAQVKINSVLMNNNTFSMNGSIYFPVISANTFDLFNYGKVQGDDGDYSLAFNKLKLIGKANNFNDYSMSYTDLSLLKSTARPCSFAGMFPAPADKLVCEYNKQSPEQMGFVDLQSDDIRNADLANVKTPWFRIEYPLILGDLGNLSGNLGFQMSLAVCWHKNNVYMAVIPPKGLFDGALAMSGFLNLGIATISISKVIDKNTQKLTGYTLELNGVELTVMNRSFPPSGDTTIKISGGEIPAWSAVYKKAKQLL
jgi:hypothetical protein